jgi:hypothetical protein
MNIQNRQTPSALEEDILDNDLTDSKTRPSEEDDSFDEGYYPDVSSPTNIQKYNDLLKDLTNFGPIIKDAVNSWLGFSWDEEKQKYARNPVLEPLMNMKGAMWCIGFLKTYARKTNFITNIDENEYNWLYLDINKVVWEDFATRDDFGVKCLQDYHMIGIQMVHFALLIITGAGGGKYNQFFGTTTMRTEHINTMPNGQNQPTMMMQQKKSGGIFGMAKKVLLGGK